ncbi:serrate RNA effector molecule-like [Ananas comosus]|uniref:Serrate RNA effector molecule-like n=1 Tax=Ananas comosus TaxID=4615 RepID=A0A6P5GMA3_ANACO|nr:serrate RNA effector molecule-like [Ananas comosus]
MAIVERKKQRARASATQFFRKLENLPLAIGSTLELMSSLLVTCEDESSAESSLETRRLILDIAQTQALALKLDTEKGIDNNILWPKNSDIHPVVKRLNRHELLRNLLEYLWSVHGVSYYGIQESEEDVGFTGVPEDVPHYEEDGWEEKLRLFWQLRLKGEDPLERRAATKDIEAAVDKAINSSVVKVEDESMDLIYGCGVTACSRPFYSVESACEHLRASHPLTVASLETQVQGQFYYENYMSNAVAPAEDDSPNHSAS